MSAKTTIEWTNATWNPVRGCSRVSEGCRNCYAERTAARFSRKKFGSKTLPFHGFVQIVNGHPAWTGKVELVEEHLYDPLHWKQPRRIFVNSMSDLFHEALPEADIVSVFRIMGSCPQHTFQVLTKRPARMLELLRERRWRDLGQGHYVPLIPNEGRNGDAAYLPNVQLGVSPHDQPSADEMVPLLLRTPAAGRFVSYEPALGPVNFQRWLPSMEIGGAEFETWLDWVIAGGESGPGARPANPQWFRNVRDQCVEAGVPFFFKQWGQYVGTHIFDPKVIEVDSGLGFFTAMKRVSSKKAAGALLDGREWRQFPEVRA
jgi:protein gp37